jgi:hypothetical protein
MIEVGGVPCVLYSYASDVGEYTLKFIRGIDTLWTSTDLTEVVADATLSPNSHLGIDLVEQGGNPCAFYVLETGILTMKRGPYFGAATAITIYNATLTYNLWPSATIVNGLLSVAYFIPSDGVEKIRFSQATTEAATTWGTSQLVSETNIVDYLQLPNIVLLNVDNLPVVGSVYNSPVLSGDGSEGIRYIFYKSTASAGTTDTWTNTAFLRSGYAVKNVSAVSSSDGETAYMSYTYLGGIETVTATASQLTTEYLSGDNANKLSYVQNAPSTLSTTNLIGSLPAFLYIMGSGVAMYFFRPAATAENGLEITYGATGYRN